MVKFSILLRKHPNLNHEEFVQYHKYTHAKLFTSLEVVREHVVKYVQSHVIPVSIPGFPEMYYDGITEIWFKDEASISMVFGAAEYLRLVRPDEEKFIAMDECSFLITKEFAII
ncbi:MAG: EthD domain-containing protein [Bacteroidota bacterium]